MHEPLLPWLEAPLRQALQAGREHPLLLVHGPEGVGQFEFALALARAWLCEGTRDGHACGACASCHLVDAHSHPDLLVLLPEALQEPLGWAQDTADAGEVRGAKGERKPSKEIRVEAARQAIDFTQLSCARGQAKVVLMYPAERMNAVAANTLLKTFEEPPGRARFVIACGDPQALPATVRSRCRALRLALPTPAEAERWLSGQGVEQPATLLAAAGGQPLLARALAGEGLTGETWGRLPQRVAQGDASALAGWAVPRAVDALLKLCHDALAVGVGAAPRYFSAVPRARDAAALRSWQRALVDAARHAEHPVNAGLLVESLVVQGRRALAGGEHAQAASLHSAHG